MPNEEAERAFLSGHEEAERAFLSGYVAGKAGLDQDELLLRAANLLDPERAPLHQMAYEAYGRKS